jgi:beta-lactamase regulating signal transducer with metallopeptidase domain
MILAVMVYAWLVGVLLCAAALTAERVMAMLGVARRAVWVVALLASLLLPAAAIFLKSMATAPGAGGLTHTVYLAADVPTVAGHGLVVTADHSARQWRVIHEANRVAAAGWLLWSVGLVAWRLVGWWRLQRRARQWLRIRLGGGSVLISADQGPAVFGFFRPRTVVPRWVAAERSELHWAILAHEQEHICAGDQLLLLAGLAAVCLAPWNPCLWWQLRRLRFAIEADCDARVLRRGVSLMAYVEALMLVGRRGRHTLVTAMALWTRPSELKRRVDLMTLPPKRTGWPGLACGVLALTLVATATALDAPALDTVQAPAPAATAGEAPDLQQLQRTVRALHPWLFTVKQPGTVLIRVLLRPSGWIDRTDVQQVPQSLDAGHLPSWVTDFGRLRVHQRELAKVGVIPVRSDANVHNDVLIAYAIRKDSSDPSGDRAAIEMAARRRFPELFRADSLATLAQVTIVMNRDGTAGPASMKVEILRAPDGRTVRDEPGLVNPPPLEHRFRTLGTAPQDIEADGEFDVIVDPALPNRVVIDYAWPKAGAPGP